MVVHLRIITKRSSLEKVIDCNTIISIYTNILFYLEFWVRHVKILTNTSIRGSSNSNMHLRFYNEHGNCKSGLWK
jgi:hypothetical protein